MCFARWELYLEKLIIGTALQYKIFSSLLLQVTFVENVRKARSEQGNTQSQTSSQLLGH